MLEFRFPDIGEGMAEGVILKWFVEVGQEVKEGDPLFLVETDKVTAEIPAPASGKILAKFGELGESIPVGEVVVKIEPSIPAEIPRLEPEAKESQEGENVAVVGALESSSVILADSGEHSPRENEQPAKKVLATPATRVLARDLGVDLREITGSGPQGRILQKDISPASRAGKPETELAEQSPKLEEERRTLTTLAKSMARTMALSQQEIPQAAVLDEFDLTKLAKLREEGRELAEREGTKLTYLPFIIKAVVLALKEFPHFNAGYVPESQEIIFKKYYNIGIAVDSPEGLVVPVIKNADRLGLLPLAEQVQTLAKKARERSLTLEEVQEGTFSITNYGAVGALSGLPIIKYPEAAIFGVGLISKKPVVVGEQIAIRKILPVTLVFDHRFIDGGEAGRFLKSLKQYLEEPLGLLLA